MKNIRYTKIILSSMKVAGIMALMLPVTGFSNPSAGSFPTAPQMAAPAQFPQMPQAPSMPTMQTPWQQQPVQQPQAYQGYQQSYPYYQMPYTSMPWMQQPAYNYYPYQQNKAYPQNPMNFNTPNYQFSKMTPFGNSFSPTSVFNNNNFPTPWSNSNNWNPWSNGNNQQMPFFSQNNTTNKKKAWGDVRNIWPDFYTDFTDEFWDKSTNGPYDMGRMPGGWRAPSLSSPDPVTVGDAVLNQFPPMMEEMGNMMNFSN